MTAEQTGEISIPERLRRTSRRQRQLASVEESGCELLELMRQRLQLPDYSQSAILDVGCGTRIPAAIIKENIPVQKYTGMDVEQEVIEFLQRHITDDRFAFRHLDLRNKMYNPAGAPLTPEYRLPAQDSYDVICLFSVFTHLDPQDADCMLSVLRRYINQDGKLIFTCFLDNEVSAFDDRDPEHPLRLAIYTEPFMRHLVSRNGWTVEAVYLPTKAKKDYWLMQHCLVCLPAVN